MADAQSNTTGKGGGQGNCKPSSIISSWSGNRDHKFPHPYGWCLDSLLVIAVCDEIGYGE
jgi:hypothetical protein